MIQTFIAFDIETTGLDPKKDRILEIGAAKYVNGKIEETYNTFLNPQARIPAKITELTGITQEMAETGISQKEGVMELIAFCGDFPLLGHNILFDYSFIKRNAVNQKISFEKEGIDTLKIARKFLKDLEKRSLSFLCKHYEIYQEAEHRALHDAIASADLYLKLLEEFGNQDKEIFEPKTLLYKAKKEGDITQKQKVYLNDLLKYHKIGLDVEIDSLSKNEASRQIDHIILNYGRIMK